MFICEQSKVAISKNHIQVIIYIFVILQTMENSLDNLLAPALRQVIELNLGKTTLNKIEQRLMESYGIGVSQAIKEFSKLDSVLTEFFGVGAQGLESKFVQNIIKLESKKESENWIILKDQSLSKMILDSFADPDKKVMMEAVMAQPLDLSAILEKCQITHASGHDKLNYLVDNGLLVPVFDSENQSAPKYQTPFNNIKMDIEKKTIVVKIQMQKSSMQQSAILKVIQ